MVEIEEIAKFIAGRTSFNGGAVVNMLWEFRDALAYFASIGQPVRLKGLGIFAPTVNKEGEFNLNYRTDGWLKSELNVTGKFRDVMVNRDMIGKSLDDMIERWNQDHPEDKIKRDKKTG